MSRFQTHALIGAVGGLGLAAALERWWPGVLTTTTMVPGVALPGGSAGLVLVLGSAFVALLPDIDEPGSFIGRRVQMVIALACIAAGIAIPILLTAPVWALAAGFIGGSLAGALLAPLTLRLVRRAAGGHRRFTHSLLLAGGLGVLAVALWWVGGAGVWIIPAALAWGILLHDVGDVVTPAGVPLFYPLSDRSIRVLPEPLCRVGEVLITVIALGVGWLLGTM